MGGVKRSGRTSLFVDTGGWIAVNDPRDRHHASASAFYRKKAFTEFKELVTTNLVIAETHAALLRAGGIKQALKFLSILDASTRLQIVYSTRELEDVASRIIVKYQDQQFSYCDAVSFAIMKEFGIKDAFVFDRHFETMGFRRLP